MASARGVNTTADAALEWGPAPPGSQPMPAHHPASERLRVVEGTVMLGHGKQWDEDKLEPLATGAEVSLAAREPHFVEAKERAVLEVVSTGPFEITDENTADDPRKAPIH